jgi:hypothetical protein
MQLDMGRFANLQLQKDWTAFGRDAFTYEVLEQKDTDKIIDVKWELKLLEKQWLEELQPYGDKGYNKPQRQ